MSAYASLFEALVWPLFLLILIFLSRKRLALILEAVRKRIEAGHSVSVGRSLFELGSGPKLSPAEPPSASTAAETNEEDGQEDLGEGEAPENPGLYLAHQAERDSSLDRDGEEYYRIQIYLESDPDVDLDIVSKVVYHLHPDFKVQSRTRRNPEDWFELRVQAWGQFALTADVYLKGTEVPLRLDRYLNF